MKNIASVQLISDIKPIKGNDKICSYLVNGWWVVDRVGAHSVGDRVVYVKQGAMVPQHIVPFLSAPNKLSQGRILPIDYDMDGFAFVAGVQIQDDLDQDVSSLLGVFKNKKQTS